MNGVSTVARENVHEGRLADTPLRRAVVHTLGCRLNQGESQMIRDRLAVAGFQVVPFGETADLGIINTCTVTHEADGKCRKAIRQFIARNPDAFTVVIGCYSQMGTAEIADIRGVDLIIGNHDKFALFDHLCIGKQPQPIILRERIDRRDFSLGFVGDLPFDQRANLKVQDGCDFMCSFCIIPFARGPARSRNWRNTLDEARAAVKRGIKELVITGVNIGTYRQGDHELEDLVDALAVIPGLLRLRISSIEPTTVAGGLLDRMGDPAHPLLPFLHLPLQSGSDRILKLMRRKYCVAEYREFAQFALQRVAGLCLGTDIMVGFTGEAEADFAATCQLFADVPFAYCHVFPFSEREGTMVMKRSEGWVPIEERNRRCAVLRAISTRQRHQFMLRHYGTTARVLLENPQQGGFPGYTENYIRVRVESAAGDIRNRWVECRLGAVRGDWMEARILRYLDVSDANLDNPALSPGGYKVADLLQAQ